MLDGRHETLLATVATALGLEFSDAVDHILEGNQVWVNETSFNL